MARIYTPRDERERDFLEQLRRKPRAKDVRVVYADWLEEADDLPAAESLRIDVALAAAPGCAEIGRLAKRLAQLRAKTAAGWRDVALRWSTPADFVLLPLDEARRAFDEAKHPQAAWIKETVVEWVESLGEGPTDPYGLVRFYRKSLAAAGDFEVSKSATAVLGDLAIEKQYTDLIESDQSLLAVAGDLRCGAIWELGSLYVAGSVRCEGTIYGASYNAARGEVLGDVEANAIIESGHHFLIHGRLDAKARVGARMSVGGRKVKGPGDFAKLDPAVLDGEGGLDEEALYQRIVGGKPVLAGDAGAVGARRARPKTRT